ncbi:MAG: hypothetical protein ACHQRM_05300 [Bacteroidia bacterium]
MKILGYYGRALRYNFPNILKPSVPINIRAAKLLEEFKENGFFKLDQTFVETAELIEHDYLNKHLSGELDKELYKKGLIFDFMSTPAETKRYLELGIEASIYISVSDSRFESLLCNEDLCSILYNYFKRQPYYRGPIHVKQDNFEDKIKLNIASKYHLDSCMHQLTFILFLCDVDEDVTHTLYAKGSHKKYWFKQDMDRYKFKDSWVEENWPIIPIFGKKGDLMIFDAGNGFHKVTERLHSTRKLAWMNITCGSDLKPGILKDKLSDVKYLEGKPAHIKKMFTKIFA